MKKIYLFLVIIFFCLTHINAKKNISGYFITNSHDTIKVVFDIHTQSPGYASLQSKIKYFDSNNIKQTLKPDMALEVCFYLKDKNVRMLSRNIDEDKTIFLHLIKDGRLKLFKYYSTSYSGMSSSGMNSPGMMTSYTSEQELLQKDNGLLFYMTSFRKEMIDFLSDCPILSKKIEEKIYDKFDLEKIVDEYNNVCY